MMKLILVNMKYLKMVSERLDQLTDYFFAMHFSRVLRLKGKQH